MGGWGFVKKGEIEKRYVKFFSLFNIINIDIFIEKPTYESIQQSSCSNTTDISKKDY